MASQYLRRLRNNSLIPVLVLGIAIVVYYYGLWNAYFSTADDFGWSGMMRNRSISEAFQGIGNGARYLHFVVIWIKAKLFYLDSAPYFLISLLQHGVVTFIVYRLVEFWSRSRLTAFLTAILFATTFSYYEVVTSTSSSLYSFWAIFYLLALAFFSLYLERQALRLYLAALGMAAILTFAHDYALTIPLMLLAYHLIFGRGARELRSFGWSDLRIHIPFWVLWGIHVTINFMYVFRGTSEAIYSAQDYGPGLHQIVNLFYLVFLIIPNVHAQQVYNFLTAYISSGQVELIWKFTVGLSIVSHALAVICFWKGSRLTRLALALTYLPFLPYTLWHGDFAGAFRYLYLPAIGFSMLLAILFTKLLDYLRSKVWLGYRFVVPGLVSLLLVSNLIVIRVWVQRHIENGQLRRAFVTQLSAEFRDIEPDSWIFIEVPQAKFIDLQYSCRLVFQQQVNCRAFVTGESTFEIATKDADQSPVYWLEVVPTGFNQIYSPASASP